MNYRHLIAIELLKLKRTASMFVLFAIPLFTWVISIIMFMHGKDITQLNSNDIVSFWQGIQAMWAYLILPLYIALVAALINHQEHRNHTWRVMFSLPISKSALFWSKFFVITLYILVANCVLFLISVCSLLVISFMFYSHGLDIGFEMYSQIPKIMIASLPVVVIYHVMAWRFHQIILPIAFGVIAAAGIVFVSSSHYWVYYPWSYALVATSASEASNQSFALSLSFTLFCVLSTCVCLFIDRLSPTE